MTKRLVIYYIPNSSAANPNPSEQLVYRGHAPSFADMWQKCHSKLPLDLCRLNGAGKILVGREDDAWIKNPSPNSPAAVIWQGTAKSGLAVDFLRRHTTLYFPALAESEADQAVEVATT